MSGRLSDEQHMGMFGRAALSLDGKTTVRGGDPGLAGV